MKRLRQLYHETLVHHASHPVGYQQEIDVTHEFEAYNPQCGDRVAVQLQLESHQIKAAAFDGEACQICLASASMLCELAPGRSTSELLELSGELSLALQPTLPVEMPTALASLEGVRAFPARVQCATLPWQAAEKALATLLEP